MTFEAFSNEAGWKNKIACVVSSLLLF